jgi:ferredoxin
MAEPVGLQIEINLEFCQGHGVCESEAPKVFRVNDDDKAELVDSAPGDDQRAAIEIAVKYCPTRALKIVQG